MGKGLAAIAAEDSDGASSLQAHSPVAVEPTASQKAVPSTQQ